jgi:excisionase family DNA binding protein
MGASLTHFEWVCTPLTTPLSTVDAEGHLTLLTAREAAAYLRVSLSTLRRMEERGQLVAWRTPGGHRRYSLQMLNACLARSVTSPVDAGRGPNAHG